MWSSVFFSIGTRVQHVTLLKYDYSFSARRRRENFGVYRWSGAKLLKDFTTDTPLFFMKSQIVIPTDDGMDFKLLGGSGGILRIF